MPDRVSDSPLRAMWTTKPKTPKGYFSVLRFKTESKGNEDDREVLRSRSDALTFAE